MKVFFNTLYFCLVMVMTAQAHEGMWLPILLNIDHMQQNGLKLSAEDIYSINQESLKDAIVHFGGGCTAEAISDEGLILTNHHCGYGAIQKLSSVENDYLKHGFWASDNAGELSCAGLSASFVHRIEDVTDRILEGVSDSTSFEERKSLVTLRSAELAAEAGEGKFLSAEVKPFFFGNQYILIIKKTYPDVRLVGAPPSSIGKFGGDTDNWVWPRHTGDFALFRIYAGEGNEPAEYSDDNEPYVPVKSLDISLKGVSPGDFTMVYGFPGVTDQYAISEAVEYVTETINPIRIKMREQSLQVIDAAMASSDELRIQYASRQSMISNAYKKWIGQNMGLDRFKAIEKKRQHEEVFIEQSRAAGQAAYVDVLDSLRSIENIIIPYQTARDLFIEFFFYGPEVLNFTRRFDALLAAVESNEPDEKVAELREQALKALESHFKDYHLQTDRAVFETLVGLYAGAVDQELQPGELADFRDKYNSDPTAYTDRIYGKSVFADREKLERILKSGSSRKLLKLKKDPLHALAASFMESYTTQVRPYYDSLGEKRSDLMRKYVKAQMTLNPEEIFWPDANSTLRVTYGKVEGCIPQDGLEYLHSTTLEGVMHKYVPGDKEFDVPDRLIQLYEEKDFGQYGSSGELNVAFLASNHTTGGNSGSPVLNANGELIGLNFDRSWESTMSDLMFNPEICRNISVDVRYILFIVDKYAGAGWLLDEMNLKTQ